MAWEHHRSPSKAWPAGADDMTNILSIRSNALLKGCRLEGCKLAPFPKRQASAALNSMVNVELLCVAAFRQALVSD